MSLVNLSRPNIFPSLNPFWENFLDDKNDFTNTAARGMSMPAVNVSEEDSSYELEVAAPGLSKKDFEVNVDQGILSISSKQEDSEETIEKNYTRKEYSYSSFCRTFSLPENANPEEIIARYENGVLNISIPKKEVAQKETSTIEIQ